MQPTIKIYSEEEYNELLGQIEDFKSIISDLENEKKDLEEEVKELHCRIDEVKQIVN